LPTLEHQQAVVVEMLRRARGEAVSFDHLRDAGVEFPASVVAELELAGIPLRRCRVARGTGRRGTGVQLDPSWAEEPPPTEAMPDLGRADEPPATEAMPDLDRADEPPATEAMPTPVWRDQPSARAADDHQPRAARARPAFPPAPSPGTRRRRISAPAVDPAAALADQARGSRPSAAAWMSLPALALTAVCVAAVVLAVSVLAGGGRSVATVGRQPAARAHTAADAGKRTTRAATGSGAGSAGTLTGTSSAGSSSAAALEARGHELLESGRYATATVVLNRAVAATGESLQDCTQPSSEPCLTYAYALYDLGRALQLSGDAAAAVPVLSQRMQIDNQRPVVMQALALARAEAHTGPAPGPEPHG
jgi:hypothetical protein